MHGSLPMCTPSSSLPAHAAVVLMSEQCHVACTKHEFLGSHTHSQLLSTCAFPGCVLVLALLQLLHMPKIYNATTPQVAFANSIICIVLIASELPVQQEGPFV